MKSSECDDVCGRRRPTSTNTVPRSLGTYPVPAEALSQLLDEFAVETVMPTERDLAGKAALAGPPGDRVGRNAQKLRNLRTGQERCRAVSRGASLFVLHVGYGMLRTTR